MTLRTTKELGLAGSFGDLLLLRRPLDLLHPSSPLASAVCVLGEFDRDRENHAEKRFLLPLGEGEGEGCCVS